MTPLHTAINHMQWEIVDLLLKHGADVDGRGFWRQTPLHVACRTHNLALAQTLIDKYHADQTLRDDRGFYPIHSACIVGSHEFFNQMYSAGYFVKDNLSLTDYEGNTPLHIAAQNDKSSLILDMLQKGASTEMRNNRQQTPYDMAKPIAKLTLEQVKS